MRHELLQDSIIQGFYKSGGMGLITAHWIIEGKTQYDMFVRDMPRYDSWTPQISKRGGIAGEFTVTPLGVEEFWIVGSGMLSAILNSSSSALTCPQAPHLKCHTDAMCDFYVAGPQSPELLKTLINTSLATADFPFTHSICRC
jgi:dimethylglycine dehydrogenase